MRFKRYGRTKFQDTPRKRSALARRQRGEREALPLFAAEIEAEQPTPDRVMLDRADQWVRSQQRTRDQRAADWRRARARLTAYPMPVRQQLNRYWQACGWPGDPTYLLSLLHMHDTGRLDQERWKALAGVATTPAAAGGLTTNRGLSCTCSS